MQFELYMASLYFATMTMTTIGYGDIHPVRVRMTMRVRSEGEGEVGAEVAREDSLGISPVSL